MTIFLIIILIISSILILQIEYERKEVKELGIKQFFKDLWNKLRFDESGQVGSSYSYQYAQPVTTTPKKTTVTAKTINDLISANTNRLAQQYYEQNTAGQANTGQVVNPVTLTNPTPTTVAGMPNLDVDLAGIWETAGKYADAEINPQLVEIDRLLQEAGYSAGESERAINEAYPIARRSLQKSIYENMVAGEQGLAAMGTGRGGGRQELLARAGEREATGIEAIETQKMREMAAIQRALENYKGQMGTTRTGLLGQRGNLQASYAEQLRGNRFNEAATKANIGLGYANLGESSRQFNESLKASSGGTGSYLDLFSNAGTTYTPTIEEINALLGTGAIHPSSQITPAQRYKNAKRLNF